MPNPMFTEQDPLQAVMTYAAELELEVDRLRSRDQFLLQHARDYVRQVAGLSKPSSDSTTSLAEIALACDEFASLLRDAKDPPGYHPAFDQVVAIAVRPLIENIFRWQQRLNRATNAVLRLDLEQEHIDWFPGRFRHVVDSLISNSLRFRDSAKGEMRVAVALRLLKDGYEFQFNDNGLGMPRGQSAGALEMLYRAAPTRIPGLGVGLAVVRFIIEQCCGTISVVSGEGKGTNITVFLPRFDIDDFVESQ
jgi:signal transduction histidine kinase